MDNRRMRCQSTDTAAVGMIGGKENVATHKQPGRYQAEENVLVDTEDTGSYILYHFEWPPRIGADPLAYSKDRRRAFSSLSLTSAPWVQHPSDFRSK